MDDNFTKLELNSPCSLLLSGVGHVRCPTLREIVNLRNDAGGELSGESLYDLYIDMCARTKAQFLEKISGDFQEDDLVQMDEVPLLHLYLAFSESRVLLLSALQFFMDEQIVFCPDRMSLELYDVGDKDRQNKVGEINADNFDRVKSAILIRNGFDPPKNTVGQRRSKKMIEFDEKLEKGRKQSRKYKVDQEAMRLGNLAAKVAARSPSTGISDIYDWTVYQLRSQFAELDNVIRLDSILTRWSVWGEKDFDFPLWYRVGVGAKS